MIFIFTKYDLFYLYICTYITKWCPQLEYAFKKKSGIQWKSHFSTALKIETESPYWNQQSK